MPDLNDELHKIDKIRERIPVTYEEADNALNKTGGDVIQALMLLESELSPGENNTTLSDKWQDLESRISGWLEKGRSTRLLVKQNHEVVAQVPVTAGLVGALLSPKLALIGAVVALVGGCQLELDNTESQDPLALGNLEAPDDQTLPH